MMGSYTQARITALKIAAQMNRRLHRDDTIPTPNDIIGYASPLAEWAYTGKVSDARQSDGTEEAT